MTSRPAEQPGASHASGPGGLRADQLVHRASHPSFTEDVARVLVAELSVGRLKEAWALSGVVLDHPASSRARTNLVVLRTVLMDALETTDPDFLSWLGTQHLRHGPGPGPGPSR